ncbi:SPOR domain-containing protein [Frigidibacter sp. ROC022]|uniref:SPOR domain-containing protein n=1 Tax=Frigidibacter sp. ROC022 TaxID=2971796 RepID=UPI003FCD8618
MAAALLQGCEEGQSPFGKPAIDEDGAAVAPGPAGPVVERDVEAPEIFQTTDEGLWDGRPSLGGVWVAYADVKDPERVIIRNEENGKFVIGALFRRERENPGPKIQVSSDAASALGMLAGAPAKLNVTALKREEIAPPEPEPAAEAPASETIAAAEEIESKPLDPVVAGAAAALDAAEGAGEAATEQAAKPLTKAQQRRADRIARREAAAAAKKAAAEAKAAADAGLPPPETALKPAEDIAAVAPAPKPVARISKPFIQIGIFSVQTNANNTATALRRDGMIPTIKKSSANGKAYWRVIVGPATSVGERAVLLKKVKALGFTDAYFVNG